MDSLTERKVEFSERMRRHQRQLFASIYSTVRDFNDAEDLFQQTSLVLWEKYTQFDPSKSFIAWACGVARIKILNFLRTRGRQPVFFTDELNLVVIEAHAEFEDEVEERREALSTLR